MRARLGPAGVGVRGGVVREGRRRPGPPESSRSSSKAPTCSSKLSIASAPPELAGSRPASPRGFVSARLHRARNPVSPTRCSRRARCCPGVPRARRARRAGPAGGRAEGGSAWPRACLFATTRVGQAPDVVNDALHGLLVDVRRRRPSQRPSSGSEADGELARRLRHEGRSTAERYAEERLDPALGRAAGRVRRGALTACASRATGVPPGGGAAVASRRSRQSEARAVVRHTMSFPRPVRLSPAGRRSSSASPSGSRTTQPISRSCT